VDDRLLAALSVSWLASAVLGYRLLRGRKSRAGKVANLLVLLVPFFGPVFYLFINFDVPAHPPFLRNDGPRGDYMHDMLSLDADLAQRARPPRERPTKPD